VRFACPSEGTVVQNDLKTFEEAARCARLSQEALTITTNSAGANVLSPELNTFMERQQSSMDQLTNHNCNADGKI
jgi:hypothetical protein